MALPPSFVGIDHVTVAWAFPPEAETTVGALGTVTGVTGFDAVEDPLSPTALVATTVKA
jgi:hypothetical protein